MENQEIETYSTVEIFYGPKGEKVEHLVLMDIKTGKTLADTKKEKGILPSKNDPDELFLGTAMMAAPVTSMEGQEIIGLTQREVRFPIENASNIKEAFANFAKSFDNFINIIKEMKRKQASSVVVPTKEDANLINKMPVMDNGLRSIK